MIQKSFGLTIKAYREAIPISQEKYALKIGMDRTYYASVESGKRNISLQNIEKICNGFEITLSELFQRVEEIDSNE
ncbi:MAG: helix-turn-helix transcriptional regulator [Clostridia bacterium]|nr:helix-turn-helix transcriptional regulator [Clostridia bacterium]